MTVKEGQEVPFEKHLEGSRKRIMRLSGGRVFWEDGTARAAQGTSSLSSIHIHTRPRVRGTWRKTSPGVPPGRWGNKATTSSSCLSCISGRWKCRKPSSQGHMWLLCPLMWAWVPRRDPQCCPCVPAAGTHHWAPGLPQHCPTPSLGCCLECVPAQPLSPAP